MKQQNIFELKGGLNQFVITQNDLGTTSSKIPILNLPEGLKIKNIFINTLQPFRSTLAPNQTSIDSCIKYKVMVGDSDNTQKFLSRQEVAVVGESGNNTGSFFTSPSVKTVPTKLIIESWISLRVWGIGGNMLTARYTLAGCGTQNAGLNFGGYLSAVSNVTEEYNGASWTSSGNLATARSDISGCGTQNAGLSCGGSTGSYSAVTEEYNGTSWGSGGNLVTARYAARCCGTQTSAVSFGGWTAATYVSVTEEYDGTTWTSSNSLNTAKTDHMAAGTQNAGLCIGGNTSNGRVATTEKYNGTTWEIAENLNAAIYHNRGGGTQSATVSCGGNWTTATEECNGTSWIISNNLNAIVQQHGGCGSQNSALIFGGYNGSIITNTEEYSDVNFNEISLSGEMILNLTVI